MRASDSPYPDIVDDRLATGRFDRRTFLRGSAAATAALLVGSRPPSAWAASNPLILDVFNVPVPDFATSNRHPGVELLLTLLACQGVFFYRADPSYPLSDPTLGLIARDDVVLIKVNGQWQYRGVTNSDVVRGVIQRVLDHPEGFAGEVVIVENGQGQGSLNCDKSWPGTYPDLQCHANAEDESHSFQYLIDSVFAEPRVSGYLLDTIRSDQISAAEHVQDGYRRSGYVSYPCFTTAAGSRVELAEGIWNGSAHEQRLKLINVPVFKHHNGSAITGALKHTYGLLSTAFSDGGYHYSRIGEATGEMFSRVRAPDLNIIDAIWVSPGALSGYPASNTVRTDRLLAGFDPVALDYHAGKYILFPAGGNPYHDPDTSADFQAFLAQARDTINANGGIRGQDVTFDELLFDVVTGDATPPSGAIRDLKVTRSGDDVRLEWSGGTPPFTVWRSERRDFLARTLVERCCPNRFTADPGVLRDGRSYYYRVE